jgi:uroporphyrinogen decarboxylase
MSTSSYEIVRSAIEFQRPQRLPLRFDALGQSDVHSVGWNQIGTGDHALRETLDEWGCLWARSVCANMGQVKGHPLADWRALDRFRWPDPDDPALYEGMEARFRGADGKYVMTGIFMLLFERLHALHGFENTLADLLLESERVEMLADRIVAFDLAIIDNISRRFRGQIHGFGFTDDWGTQQNLFIKPLLWDQFFKPRYKRIFDAAHQAGWHVWMHTCGKVNAIIEGLIEIGLDVINLQQPRALGIEEIGARFRGRIFQGRGRDSPGGTLATTTLGHARWRVHPLRLRRWASHRRRAGEKTVHAGCFPEGRSLEARFVWLVIWKTLYR